MVYEINNTPERDIVHVSGRKITVESNQINTMNNSYILDLDTSDLIIENNTTYLKYANIWELPLNRESIDPFGDKSLLSKFLLDINIEDITNTYVMNNTAKKTDEGIDFGYDYNTSKYLKIENFDFPLTFTLHLKVKKYRDDADQFYLSFAIDGANNELIISEQNNKTYVYFDDDYYVLSDTIHSNINEWFDILLIVRDKESITLDINNNRFSVGLDNSIKSTHNNVLIFGQEQDSVGGGFVAGQNLLGVLQIFEIYNRVLTDFEIDKLKTQI